MVFSHLDGLKFFRNKVKFPGQNWTVLRPMGWRVGLIVKPEFVG